MKTCSWCKKPKPPECFSVHKGAADGLAYHCKACHAAYEREQRVLRGTTSKTKRLRDPQHLIDGMKECFRCDKLLRLNAFSPAARGWGGVAYACRVCASASVRNNRDAPAHAAYIRNWRANNPNWPIAHRAHQYRRRDKQKNRLPWGAAAKVLRRRICHYCAQPTPREKRTIDHVVALSKGGPNTPENIVMACGTCNFRKSNLSESEFRKRQQCKQ